MVARLVARNSELERLLSKLREKKKNGDEHISAEQLDLLVDKLRQALGGELAEADEKLSQAAKKNG